MNSRGGSLRGGRRENRGERVVGILWAFRRVIAERSMTKTRCYAQTQDAARTQESKMLTVMCPNCRHRFPAPGCCEPSEMQKNLMHPTACYYGGLLVPRGYTSGGGCFINAPTIVHGPAIIQSGVQQCGSTAKIITTDSVESDKFRIHGNKPLLEAKGQLVQKPSKEESYQTSPECHITTTCDLTGGSVTITTPSIQSGGCLIQSTDSGILVQAPHIEIRPKLSGGGCLVEKRLSTDDQESVSPILLNEDGMGLSKYKEDTTVVTPCCGMLENSAHQMLLVPPSGCQELPGNRRNAPAKLPEEKHQITNDSITHRPRFSTFEPSTNTLSDDHRFFNKENQEPRQQTIRKSCCCNNVQNISQNHIRSTYPNVSSDNRESLLVESNNGVQIQVNATVQLPASLGQCTVNITATTANTEQQTPARSRNNFNGGGLVQPDGSNNVNVSNNNNCSNNTYHNERRDGAPTTPVSWLMPCPWGFDTYLMDKDVARLCEVKRLLQTCGWYHEGLSWQQSESLLKDTPVGRWLMRDSSDSRYTFAVSVQTARGPTSVRVHYFLGRFRLDAEPSLALAMPLFDCPIKMLEHYVEYSKRMDEHRTEVWVDYSGQLYSQIYLTKPLVKEVRSLSHLARLAVHRNKLPTDHLPPLIKNYLAEYPYTL